jgi:predicted alpha/beta-fold hydrolase
MPVVYRDDYIPPRLLRHNIAMYAWANAARRVPKPPYERFERVQSPTDSSGSFFELAWWRVAPGEVGDKVALIAPGLSGAALAQPTRGMARALHEEGWDVAVWVYRDTGTVPTSVRRTYSGYGLDDFTVAVDRLKGNYDQIALVGMSLGGNLVAQYVCAIDDSPISRAVAISALLAFGSTVKYWSQAMIGRAVISSFARKDMKQKVKRKARSTGAVTHDDVSAYARVRTAAQADHYINTEFNGYPGASQYWHQATTLTALGTTRANTPLLIIQARDDFMLESHSYPHADMLAPNITMELTRNGSHISFVPRGWSKHRYWSEQRTVDFLTS